MSVDRLVDLVLVAFALEAVFLAAWLARRDRRALVRLVPTLFAGLFLALALKAVVASTSALVVAALLAAAGVAHAVDLVARLRRR